MRPDAPATPRRRAASRPAPAARPRRAGPRRSRTGTTRVRARSDRRHDATGPRPAARVIVVQFGTAIIRASPRSASGFTSGIESGTPGSMRNAERVVDAGDAHLRGLRHEGPGDGGAGAHERNVDAAQGVEGEFAHDVALAGKVDLRARGTRGREWDELIDGEVAAPRGCGPSPGRRLRWLRRPRPSSLSTLPYASTITGPPGRRRRSDVGPPRLRALPHPDGGRDRGLRLDPRARPHHAVLTVAARPAVRPAGVRPTAAVRPRALVLRAHR